MSEETLHTAARRLVRYLDIDLNRGGFVTLDTERALDTLRVQVERENLRQRARAAADEARATALEALRAAQ